MYNKTWKQQASIDTMGNSFSLNSNARVGSGDIFLFRSSKHLRQLCYLTRRNTIIWEFSYFRATPARGPKTFIQLKTHATVELHHVVWCGVATPGELCTYPTRKLILVKHFSGRQGSLTQDRRNVLPVLALITVVYQGHLTVQRVALSSMFWQSQYLGG